MARELDVNIKITSGPVLEKPGDLAGLLTNLEHGDILFIDEIHRLRPVIEEYLYPAMEDYRIEIRLSEGARAQTVSMKIEQFTLVGATTRFGLLTAPMRARFGVIERLNYYPPEELALIVRRSATLLEVTITDEACEEIARRSRGTPRIANRLLRRVRDVLARERLAPGNLGQDIAADRGQGGGHDMARGPECLADDCVDVAAARGERAQRLVAQPRIAARDQYRLAREIICGGDFVARRREPPVAARNVTERDPFGPSHARENGRKDEG